MSNSRLLTLASLFAALLCAASPASAASYAIYGRVYSAARLLPGETAPTNPLSAVPASQVLMDAGLEGVSLYAVTPKSLVRISVEDPSGAALAPAFLVRYSGGFTLSFTNPAASLNAKLVVRDPVSNIKLMETAPVALSATASGNTFYLLVEGEREEMGRPTPGTKLFTMVGKIPNDGSSITSAGLANVSAATAAALGIPQYRDAPFGSTLSITGAFSSQFYKPGKYCYKIFADGVPLTDPLYKTRYTVKNVGGTLTAKAEMVMVGPQTTGVPGCYSVTPISASVPGEEVFWGSPDQLIRWNTSAIADGMRTLTLKLYNAANNPTGAIGTQVALASNPFSTLKLRINNEKVVVNFPSIVNGAKDMLHGHACDIVDLNNSLSVTYQAYHPNPAGFLGSYAFTVIPNSGAGLTIASGSYTGTPFTGTPAAGATATLDHTNITHPCAYVLSIGAVARTTDGYWNFNRSHTWKAYYLQ